MASDEGPIESISAVTLVTGRMDEAVAFYEALGFVRLYGGPNADFTSFRAGVQYLNLQQVDGRGATGSIWGRVIFYVADVDAMHERVVAAGFAPETLPADAPWRERYFHVRDPDGHQLSFARPLPPQAPTPF
mgnify:CR=1 FL=1